MFIVLIFRYRVKQDFVVKATRNMAFDIVFNHIIFHSIYYLQGVPKNLLESGEQYIVGSPFNFVFVRVSDKTQNKCSKDSFIQIYN